MMHKAQKGMAKWTVRILLGLLIASFALWGIADYATGPVNPVVASVGDREITSNEFTREAQRRIQIVRQQQNQVIDQRTAIAMGLYQSTLSALIDRNALLDKADGLSLGVGDASIVAEIHGDPAFQGPTGNFDRLRFESIIRNANFTETRYIEARREDMINRQIEESIMAGLDRGHQHMAEAILAYQLETRDVSMILIPNEKIGEAATPSEADLTTFHEENAARFSTPARRSGRVLVIRPSDVAENIVIDEQPIRDAYENRIGEFTQTETRAIRQAILPDEAAAQAIIDRVGEGVTFDAAVEEATGGPAIDLGIVGAGGLPGEVGDAAFAAGANSVAGPVQSQFGWHVIEIGDVSPEVVQPLESVREQLIADLRLEGALEQMIDIANQIEDELAGGATVQDLAASLELPMIELPAVDRGGEAADGATPAADLPGRTLALLFSTAPGDELTAEEQGDGTILLVETTSIEEPSLKSFAEVRDAVAAAWKAEKLGEVAAAERVKLEDRLKAGAKLEALALEFGVTIRKEEGITRQSGLPELAGEARQAAFSADEGGAAGGASPLSPNQILAVVTAIKPAKIGEDDQQVNNLSATIGEVFADDIRLRYLEAIREEAGYSINQPAYRAAVDPNGIYLN